MSREESSRFHADRAPGRHRDHRRPDRPAVARRAGGPRGGPPGPVHQQPQADRARPAQLPHGDGQVPDGRLEEPPSGGPATPTGSGATAAGPAGAPRRCCWATSTRPRCTTRPISASARVPPGDAWEVCLNSTVYNAVINSFLCPSDPNADSDRSNSYHASIGSTTYESPITTPGMFAVWTAYGIRDCTDGTSNTIAFAEALTGRDNAGFGRNTSAGRPPTGATSSRTPPTPAPAARGRTTPRATTGRAAQFLYASANSAAVLAGLQACATAVEQPGHRVVFDDARVQLVRRQRRLDLYQHHPDAQPRLGLPRRGLPVQLRRLRHRQLVQLRRLEQPPGRGEHPDDRRQRPVRQGQRGAAHLVGPRHPQRRRGHQLR